MMFYNTIQVSNIR